MTSKRRKRAEQGSRGMWDREAGEAAVWEAASLRGRRPAHLGTSCTLGWWPRTCTQPGRLPPPKTAVLSQSHGFLERGLGGRGPPPPPLALFSRLAFALPSACSCGSWHWLPPSPKLYTSAGPIPKSWGGDAGGPGSAREHAPLLLPRGPLGAGISCYYGSREREEGQAEEWV